MHSFVHRKQILATIATAMMASLLLAYGQVDDASDSGCACLRSDVWSSGNDVDLVSEECPQCGDSEQTSVKVCCCNPDSVRCDCGNCNCSDSTDQEPIPPMAPGQCTMRLVWIGLVPEAPCGVIWAKVAPANTNWQQEVWCVAESAQNKCAVLSRFMC